MSYSTLSKDKKLTPLKPPESFCSVQFSRSVVSDSLMTPWATARQAPLSMGFFRQEYWSGLPPPGDLLDPEIKPEFPALAGGFFHTEPPGKPQIHFKVQRTAQRL